MSSFTAAEVRLLANQLQTDPLKHANTAVKLLSCVKDFSNEPASKAAVQTLKLFFITACDEGKLQRKRAKLDAAATPTSSAPAAVGTQADPEAIYVEWLQRQYSSYISALLQLLSAPASASLQVCVLSSLMECVRHDQGPATLSQPLYASTLTTCITSPHVQPEVFALLFTRYLSYADVRYHTLRTLARFATQRAVRSSSSSSKQPPSQEQQEGAEQADAAVVAPSAADSEEEQQEDLAAGSRELPAPDVARNMFDVLAAVPATMPAVGSVKELSSWCGAAEAGLVTAAADAVESAKARRKRKQRQQQEGLTAPTEGGLPAVAWANSKVQQRAFGAAWLAFLLTDLPQDIYRKVLLKLHADVIPNMTDPILLSDFLTHALSAGGMEGMLALHGIFTLVTRYGLEYPSFYTRLYQLITPAALRSKHRVQFFKLVDVFLNSGLVPAYSAAAFVKRFARSALTAPAAGALLCIAFIHNIIRRHPSCMVLLHKPSRRARAPAAAGQPKQQQQQQEEEEKEEEGEPLLLEPAAAAGPSGVNGAGARSDGGGASSGLGVDVYDDAQGDPGASRAVESSLWELDALRRHYCPQVSTFVSILDKDLGDRVRTAEVDLDPLLPSSTASLISTELNRRLKSVPLAFYDAPPKGVWGAAWGAQGLTGRAVRREENTEEQPREELPGWTVC